MLDPRLAGAGLRDLVDLLSDALPQPEAIGVLVDRAELPAGRIRRSGTPLYDWHAAVTAADDGHPGTLDRLLVEISHYMQNMPTHKANLEAWLARGQRRTDLVAVAEEIERLAASVRACADPRKSAGLLDGLRGTVLDIREGFQTPDLSTPLLAVDAASADAARSEILGACRQALTAVDNLITGVQLAAELAKKRRPSDGEELVFTREHAIVRVLIDDREDVDAGIEDLLSTLKTYAPALLQRRRE